MTFRALTSIIIDNLIKQYAIMGIINTEFLFKVLGNGSICWYYCYQWCIVTIYHKHDKLSEVQTLVKHRGDYARNTQFVRWLVLVNKRQIKVQILINWNNYSIVCYVTACSVASCWTQWTLQTYNYDHHV